LHGLNIPIPETVDGRILFEALVDHVDPAPEQVSESVEAGHLDFRQVLKTTRVGTSNYIDGGWRIS
jgi:hypothetical protein